MGGPKSHFGRCEEKYSHCQEPNSDHPVLNQPRNFNLTGIALGYGLDDRDSRVPVLAAAGNFSLHLLWGPSSLLFNGYRELFPWGLKRPGREADHSPPSSAEVKNAWSYTSTSPYAFMIPCSLKAQGQLYLYLT
jgi:hypothetical protein